ncbi:Rap1a/Tai family immunity protein [Hafnia alvei]|uniref:Rap1a/Tai family immunity protein n=1 Tax=Hafnia alvei TaxID=569 RepID=UPI00345CC800
MKKLYKFISLLMFFPLSSFANSNLSIDGNSLYKGYQLYERGFDYLNNADYQKALMYMTYVAGVAGTLSTIEVICNKNITIGQEADIVGIYLREHPKERTDLSPAQLTMVALVSEIPCPKK